MSKNIESQVSIYIKERIYLEWMVLLKYCKAILFLGSNWPKSGEQMYATNDLVNQNDTYTLLSIFHLSGLVFGTWHGPGWSSDLNINYHNLYQIWFNPNGTHL